MSGGSMRPAGAAGLLGVVLGAVGSSVLPIWAFPTTGASNGQIAAFVETHRDQLLAGMVANVAAITLWLAFGLGVWTYLRQDAGDDFATACVGGGVIAFVTLLFAGFTAFSVLVYRAPHASDPRLLYDLTFGLLAISGAPTVMALSGYAVKVYRDGILPRITAHIAIVAIGGHAALIASFIVRQGFFSLHGAIIIAAPAALFAWIAATGIALINHDRSSVSAAGRPTENAGD